MQGKFLSLPMMVASFFIIALIVFGNTLFFPFVHDDLIFIVQNPQISRLDRWLDVFASPGISTEGAVNAYYRPVLEIVYRLQYALFGFNPAGFHLTNILIHALNGVLIFFLLLRLNFAKGMAYAVSVLFLVHPLQTEAVACVAGISNLLCTVFILGTLLLYLRQKYLLAFVMMAAAFLTKEQAVVLPLLLVLLDVYRSKKNYGWWAAGFMWTAVLLGVRGHITQGHLLADILSSPGELQLRLLAIPRTLLMYLGLIVFPSGLHYYRNTDILASNTAGVFGLMVLTAGVGWILKKCVLDRKMLCGGLLWFVIVLLPVLNIVPLVNEYSFILTAEHFLYLPIVGILLVIVVLAARFISPPEARKLLVLLIIMLGALSIYQNRFWSSETALFERMSRYEPAFGRGQLLLARAYQAKGEFERALGHYDKALKIMQGYEDKVVDLKAKAFYAGFIKDIYFYKGQVLALLGRGDEAIRSYEETLKRFPYYEAAVFEAMGLVYLQSKNFDKAAESLNKALSLNPQNASLLNNLAIVYLQEGDKVRAEQFFKMALGVDVTYAAARQNLNRLMEGLN